jgi:sulfatase maturation enzyme AslB (radical SAM superfamily)
METKENKILLKLEKIENKLKEIKKKIITNDSIMDEEDFNSYKKSLNKENLISIDEVKKKLKI